MTSIFVYRGLYFGLYDSGKSLIPSMNQDSIFQKYLLAQAVTIGSETLTYPFDTVRIRMMMNSGLKEKIYKNSIDCY